MPPTTSSSPRSCVSVLAPTTAKVPPTEAKRLCPELNAAVDWALRAQRCDVALVVARTLAVGGEQFGPDIDSLSSISRTARDPKVRDTATAAGAARPRHRLELHRSRPGRRSWPIWRSASDRQPSASWPRITSPGTQRPTGSRARSALTHLDCAERLADELGDTWQLASIRQARGIALRGRELDDPEGALAAFEQAMHTYALAGDAMHVNNARYMMASTVADAGLDVPDACEWAEECAAYARRSGNRHELAHAILTRAALGACDDVEADLTEVMARFRAVGDLRCLTRCYLLLAKRAPTGGADRTAATRRSTWPGRRTISICRRRRSSGSSPPTGTAATSSSLRSLR